MNPHSRDIRWRDLARGVAIMFLIALSAMLILTRIGLGNMPGHKFTFFALTEQARGILRGSNVWIAGTKVGTVSDVHFLKADPGSEGRVLLELSVLEEHRDHVRRDAHAEVRPGTRLIGNPVLEISQGSPAEPAVADGDTIETVDQIDVEAVAARAQAAIAALPPAISDFRRALGRARGMDTILASLFGKGDSSEAASPYHTFLATLEDLAMRFESGPLGKLVRDSALVIRFGTALESFNSALRSYDVYESAAGRYMINAALPARIDSVLRRFDTVTAQMRLRMTDLGSGARAATLNNELQRLVASIRALQADARRHPLKYIVF